MTLVIWVGFAFACYGIAQNKERNPYIAFGWGLLFGLFTLLYYLIAPGSKEYELKRLKN